MSVHLDEMRRLIDRAAIHDVHVRYFRGIDAADKAQVRRCFTDDVRASYDARASVDGIEAVSYTHLGWVPDRRCRTGRAAGS